MARISDRRVGQSRLQEKKRVRVLALHSRLDAAEVLHDELRQEVAQLGRLRLIARGVVCHCLRPADVIDSDHQWLYVRVQRCRLQIQSYEPDGHEC